MKEANGLSSVTLIDLASKKLTTYRKRLSIFNHFMPPVVAKAADYFWCHAHILINQAKRDVKEIRMSLTYQH